jgi:hypothetical protein
VDLQTAAAGRLSKIDETRLCKVSLGANLGVALNGRAGQDFDLDDKHGAAPTTEDYEAIGHLASAGEEGLMPAASPGGDFIRVRSYRGSGDFDLKVDLEK